MRGRTAFQLVEPVLTIAIFGLRLLPAPVSRFLFLLSRFIPTRLGIVIRYCLLQRIGKQCGRCVAVWDGVYLLNMQYAELGDHVSIHPMCYIDACGGLKIGNHVSIAHSTTIMTSEHDYASNARPIRENPCILKPVTIGNNVWIGAGVRILAGVDIGDRTVIGAGSVVTRSLPSGSVCVGVPAKPIKSIREPNQS